MTVAVDDRTVATLRPVVCFGEVALLRNVPRTATVTSTTASTLWSIDRLTFLEAVGAVDGSAGLFEGDRARYQQQGSDGDASPSG